MARSSILAAPLRTKNGIAAGDLATYCLVNGATIGLLALHVERDGDYMRLTARVTSRTAHGYTRGETVTLRDSAFIMRRPRVGEPPNHVITSAMAYPARSFVWHDSYGIGWTSSDRPPANATFYIIDGKKGPSC